MRVWAPVCVWVIVIGIGGGSVIGRSNANFASQSHDLSPENGITTEPRNPMEVSGRDNESFEKVQVPRIRLRQATRGNIVIDHVCVIRWREREYGCLVERAIASDCGLILDSFNRVDLNFFECEPGTM